jgi:hypothetical protein
MSRGRTFRLVCCHLTSQSLIHSSLFTHSLSYTYARADSVTNSYSSLLDLFSFSSSKQSAEESEMIQAED